MSAGIAPPFAWWYPLVPWRFVRWRIACTEVARARFNARTVGPVVPAGSRLLDVGSWDARTAALLRDERSCDVLAVDVVDKNVTDVPFATFDGTTLPAEDGSRDVVTFLYVLHHAADDLALLREAARVLAPGGRIVVAEDMVETPVQRAITVGFHVWLWLWTWMGWDGRFRTRREWAARFSEAGLAVAETRELGPHLGRALWPRNVLFVLERA